MKRPVVARGFTLIEVLVALAIVAVALTAGLKAAGTVSDNAQRLADVTAAQWCAENRLTELRQRNDGFFIGIGVTAFECQQLGRSFEGRLIVRATAHNDIRVVEAAVADAAGTPLVTVSTALYRY